MLIEYENTTGRITQLVFDPVRDEVVEAYMSAGANILSVPPEMLPADFDIDKSYVLNGEPVQRPHISVPVEITIMVGEEVALSDLPNPCTVVVDDVAHEVTGGLVRLSGDMISEYMIHVEAWPYLPKTIKVTVNAS